MPAHRKPADRRQRRNRPPELVAPPKAMPTPAPPAGLTAATKRAWATFWESDVARVVESTDLPALTRLFELHQERSELWRAYQEERLVKGSKGQPVLNPLAKMLAQVTSEIRTLEAAFGLTPAARVRLGLHFAAATKTLRELSEVPDEVMGYDETEDE